MQRRHSCNRYVPNLLPNEMEIRVIVWAENKVRLKQCRGSYEIKVIIKKSSVINFHVQRDLVIIRSPGTYLMLPLVVWRLRSRLNVGALCVGASIGGQSGLRVPVSRGQ